MSTAASATRSSRRRRTRSCSRFVAELDALAEADGIDEETAKQLLLRLRERKLRRELESADDAHVRELQHRLAEVRTAIREFA